MNNQFCYHSFNPEEHNGKTWMVCAKCGLRNPLGLFQHWDTERDGTPVFAKYSDSTGPGRNINKGRSSGPHLQWVKNTTGKIEDIITREEWDKANPPLSQPKKIFFDHMIDAFKAPFKPQPKRQPIIAIRKDPDSPYYPWIWSCQICSGEPDLGTNFDKCVDWQIALIRARNHARNHHKGWPQ